MKSTCLNFIPSSSNFTDIYQIKYGHSSLIEIMFNETIIDKSDLRLLFYKVYDREIYNRYFGVQVLYYEKPSNTWNLTGLSLITCDKITETIDNFELYTGKSKKPQFISFLVTSQSASFDAFIRRIILKRG